jgi:hypothetical protein
VGRHEISFRVARTRTRFSPAAETQQEVLCIALVYAGISLHCQADEPFLPPISFSLMVLI